MTLVLSSCSKFPDFGHGAATLTLNLVPSGMEIETKTAGVDAFNENKLEVVDIFLFESGETTALYRKHASVTGTSANVLITDDEITALGSPFDVLVIANLPSSVTLPTVLSQENLDAIALTMDGTQTQSSFVMKGESTATGSGSSYSASVALSRVAVKFTFAVNVIGTNLDGTLDGASGPWNLDTDEDIELKFGGSQKTGEVSGNPVKPGANDVLESDDYEDVDTPFYSYPRSVRVEQRPYAIIKVPFNNGSVTKYSYYKVFYPRNEFSSNVWYSLEAQISLLGADSEPEAGTIPESEMNYSAAAWRVAVGADDYNQNTIVKDAHYLVVYSNEYTLENVNSIDIPFTSSHDCEITSITAKYTDFSTNVSTTKDVSTSDYSITIPTGSQVIHLEHELDNNWLTADYSGYDVSQFVFTFTIRQKSPYTSYAEVITVRQNPAITITAESNTYGYIYLNNYQVSGTSSNNLNSTIAANLGGHYTRDTQTTNMFIIRVSALPDDCPYVIGDPRELTRYTGWTSTPTPQSATKITGGTGTPTNYYRTRDDGTADNIIAPVFRTASGYSRCYRYTNNYSTVNKRAIAYQEGQYPAARWRLLSKAEAQIVAKLNHDGKIPQLFSDTNNFFVAGGYINGETIYNGTTGEGSVRLCYDEWYWSNSGYATCNPSTFTWGDVARSDIK